jgi:hypothetical protein
MPTTCTIDVMDLVSALLGNQQLNPSILPPAKHKQMILNGKTFQHVSAHATQKEEWNLVKQACMLWRVEVSDKSLSNIFQLMVMVIHNVRRGNTESEHFVNIHENVYAWLRKFTCSGILLPVYPSIIMAIVNPSTAHPPLIASICCCLYIWENSTK